MDNALPVGKKKILVVEDESSIRELICKFLIKEGFEASGAENGLDAQQKLGLEKFEIVLSDVNMPSSRVSGLELLQYVKKQFSIPVVLMTGFASIANANEAHAMGADAFIAKPFKHQELLSAIKTCLGMGASVTPENSDENFCKLSIGEFISGKKIQQSIFVRLGAGKYVKVAHQGEDMPVKQIEAYKSKGIQYLYLTKEDFLKYVSSSLAIAKAACRSKTISNDKKIGVVKHASKVILENLHQHPLTKLQYEEAKSIVETSVGFLGDEADTVDLLASLNHYSDSLYAHSVGVSFYSALIARELQLSSPLTLVKISLAGLLHDIGFKEIDPAITNKPRAALTPAEVKILEGHPIRGVNIIADIPRIPEEILQIIMQHHEREGGYGYPLGLQQSKIHPFAKIIAVADEFCDLAIQKNGDAPMVPALAPMDALRRIEGLHHGILDSAALEALRRILTKNKIAGANRNTELAKAA